jgi:hypothetical protein
MMEGFEAQAEAFRKHREPALLYAAGR